MHTHEQNDGYCYHVILPGSKSCNIVIATFCLQRHSSSKLFPTITLIFLVSYNAMCFGESEKTYDQMKFGKDHRVLESSNTLAGESTRTRLFKRQYDAFTAPTVFTNGSQASDAESSINLKKRRTVHFEDDLENSGAVNPLHKILRAFENAIPPRSNDDDKVYSSSLSIGNPSRMLTTSGDVLRDQSNVMEGDARMSYEDVRNAREEPLSQDNIYLWMNTQNMMASGKYAYPEIEEDWKMTNIPGYRQRHTPAIVESVTETESEDGNAEPYQTRTDVITEAQLPSRESETEEEDEDVGPIYRKRGEITEAQLPESESEFDQENVQYSMGRTENYTVPRTCSTAEAERPLVNPETADVDSSNDDEVATADSQFGENIEGKRSDDSSYAESEDNYDPDMSPGNYLAMSVRSQIRQLGDPSILKLLDGYDAFEDDLCVKYMNDSIREICSYVDPESEREVRRNPLKYSPDSPPFLFELSDNVAPWHKLYIRAVRLRTEKTAGELESEIRRAEGSFVYFAPKIFFSPHSPLRVLETRDIDYIDTDGTKKTRKGSMAILNLLRADDSWTANGFWARYWDIMATFSSPTLLNPLPILSSRFNLEDLPTGPWSDAKYARPEITQFLEKEQERFAEVYGEPSDLQKEGHQIAGNAVRTVCHLPGCLSRGDLTGLFDISRNLRKVCDAIDALGEVDYDIREKAMMTFPLFNRKSY